MNGYAASPLFSAECASCGRDYVGARMPGIVRPDLCHPCFGRWLEGRT